MQFNRIGGFALGGLVALSSPLPAAESARKPTLPDPNTVVQRMCDHLKSLDRFSFRAEITDDQVYAGGKRLQYSFDTETFVQRPDKLRVNALGDLIDKQVFLSGKTLTMYDPADKVYASVEVPADLEGALAHADQTLHFRIPLGDLASPRLCEHLAKGQVHALFVGASKVRGIPADHLAFDRNDMQFQVWVATGDKPLPLKLVITQKGLPGAPQWTAILSDWKAGQHEKADRFTFVPPSGVHQIRFAAPTPAQSSPAAAAPAATAPKTGVNP